MQRAQDSRLPASHAVLFPAPDDFASIYCCWIFAQRRVYGRSENPSITGITGLSGIAMAQENNGRPRASEAAHLQNTDDLYYKYQITFLHNELRYTQKISNTLIWKLCEHSGIIFLSRHLQQFYWTVTRALGLGYLHDGSGRPVLPQERVKLQAGPRILVDVTVTHRYDAKSGIQRVVREIAKASIENGRALPVIMEGGQLLSYFRHPDLPDFIEIGKDDRFLLLDTGWCLLDEYRAMLAEVSRRGGRNICCVYDLTPVLYSGLAESVAGENFPNWIETILLYCDAVVTISNSVAEDFINYLSAHNLPHRPSLRIGWFHLGADFAAETEGSVSRRVQGICEGAPFFLSVGTLEPRKNYSVALAAFELLWKSGVDVRYVIVGEFGWLTHALRDQILHHPEFGRRLFWLQGADDKVLSALYRHATAAVQPSIAEGFGLPIVEAAHFGTPVIASDIRVFREVGGDSISYFDPMDPDALARCVREALANPRVAPSVVPLTWKEATARLLQLIIDESYPYTLSSKQ